jgi:hypothetical protein
MLKISLLTLSMENVHYFGNYKKNTDYLPGGSGFEPRVKLYGAGLNASSDSHTKVRMSPPYGIKISIKIIAENTKSICFFF